MSSGGLPVAGKTYFFRVPYEGFYIWVLKKVGLLGYRWGLGFRASGLGFSGLGFRV